MRMFLIIFATFALSSSLSIAKKESPDRLSNGSPFFAEEDRSLPRNLIVFSYKGVTELLPPEKQGIFKIIESLIEEGPSNTQIKEHHKNLFLNGTELSAHSEYGLFKIYLQTPPEKTDFSLHLLKQTLTHLRIGEDDFNRAKDKVNAEINTSFESMKSVILYFSIKDLFNYIPQVMNGSTSPLSFNTITHEDLKKYLPLIIDPKNLFVSYVGPTSKTKIQKNIEVVFKKDLQKKFSHHKRLELPPPVITGQKYTLIHKENATDNQIFILYPQQIKHGSVSWYEATVLQHLLGGGLGSALNKTLRVERGLTYGASSRWSGLNFPYWYIATFGGLQQTKPLLKGIDEVLLNFISTPSTDENFEASIEILLNAFQAGRELAYDRISSLAAYYANNLNPQVLEEFPVKIKNIKKSQVESFKKELQYQNAAVYLMGNKDFLTKTLLELGVKTEDIRIVNFDQIR